MPGKDSLFELLCSKDIIAILDGDTSFGNYEFDDGSTVKMALPYQSGPDLCGICTLFGYPMTYAWGGGNMSRWQYVDELIKHCIKYEKCSDLLSYFFGKSQFSKVLNGHSPDEIESAYHAICDKALKQINGLLYFGRNELTVVGNRFYMHPLGSKVEIETPKIKTIDRAYIKSISERALQDVEQSNYDSAITKSRTLLEETFCYVIEKKNITPSTSGDIGTLYKQVKDQYNMHGDSNTDKRINMLLSGLEKIVSAISEMRNKDSDAHGVGANRIAIDEHHARLFVNSAITMAEFILAVAEKQK